MSKRESLSKDDQYSELSGLKPKRVLFFGPFGCPVAGREACVSVGLALRQPVVPQAGMCDWLLPSSRRPAAVSVNMSVKHQPAALETTWLTAELMPVQEILQSIADAVDLMIIPLPPPLARIIRLLTHPLVHAIGALLKLLLDLLLQEVDPELQAEVLLLQVVEVLRDGATTGETGVRHGVRWLRCRGHRSPPFSAAQYVKRQGWRGAAAMHSRRNKLSWRDSGDLLSPAVTHQQAGTPTETPTLSGREPLSVWICYRRVSGMAHRQAGGGYGRWGRGDVSFFNHEEVMSRIWGRQERERVCVCVCVSVCVLTFWLGDLPSSIWSLFICWHGIKRGCPHHHRDDCIGLLFTHIKNLKHLKSKGRWSTQLFPSRLLATFNAGFFFTVTITYPWS